MTGRLEGRVAVVTGASRGLGAAIARALAADGAAVGVVARTEQVWDERLPGTIGETVAQIEAAGGHAVAVRADLLEPGDPNRLIDEVRNALGPISILVNNAAFTAPGRPPTPGAQRDASAQRAPAAQQNPGAQQATAQRPTASSAPPSANAGNTAKADWPAFVGTPVRAFRRHFEIGVFAVYELMQLAAADMIAAGSGAIVNITSGASRMPGDGPYVDRSGGMLPGYGGSKAALEHLTQCAAFDLQPHGIAVNALSPSKAILTPGVAYYSREFDDVGSAEDFGEAAVRLSFVDPDVVTGRTIGHLDVLNESYRPWVGGE